jgi:hypothetical protein
MRPYNTIGNVDRSARMSAAFTRNLEIAENLGDAEYHCARSTACISVATRAVDTVLRWSPQKFQSGNGASDPHALLLASA